MLWFVCVVTFVEPAERNYFLLIVVVCVALGTCSVGTLANKNCSFAALLSGVASLVVCWNSAAGSKISQSVETWQLADCSLFAALLGAKQSSHICNLAVLWQSELPSLCFCVGTRLAALLEKFCSVERCRPTWTCKA